MIDQYFREWLPRYTDRLIKLYEKYNLTPNNITVAGLVFALIAAVFVALEWNMLAIATWWFGRLLDGTDGILARHSGQSSFFGAYLDITCDMAAYGAMILGFAVAHGESSAYWMIILFLYILCITSALSLGNMEEKLGVGADQQRSMRLGAGLAEAGETGIAYTLFLLFPSYIVPLSTIWILVLISTIVFRTILAKKVLQ